VSQQLLPSFSRWSTTNFVPWRAHKWRRSGTTTRFRRQRWCMRRTSGLWGATRRHGKVAATSSALESKRQFQHQRFAVPEAALNRQHGILADLQAAADERIPRVDGIHVRAEVQARDAADHDLLDALIHAAAPNGNVQVAERRLLHDRLAHTNSR